ncbi:unnamed protein product [Ilex paraguariensis]|uniref:Putative plant transposon protein domain-containing protein n=1 Tax=Ilex paraguariensis TaxID=185542 RepID=A0ABC8T7G2_9AQUA
MARGTAGVTKKRKPVNGMTKQVVIAQKKKDGETDKSSKGDTGCNWENIFDVKKDDKAYNNVVRLFYANLHDFDKVGHTLKSVVKGKEIKVFPNFISKMLKVPKPVITENSIVFPYKSKEEVLSMETVIETICGVDIEWADENNKIYQKNLRLLYRMLNIIVACNIDPKGHTTEFGYDRAQLLYAIGKGGCIDLPHYIF